ncbi:MAG: DUF4091 domain-containing protein [Lentisphaeria bacterium]|jgi:hypothetical protein
MRQTHRLLSLAVMLLGSVLMAAEPWHFPLYLDGGRPAKKRREILIDNPGKRAIDGEQLRLRAADLGLADTPRRELRVVGNSGQELLYALEPDGEIIGADTELLIPAQCAAQSTASIWLYYDNPAAWDIPDFWREDAPKLSQGFTDSFEDGDERIPPGWEEKDTDERHINLRAGDVARSGTKSLHTRVLPGSEPSWVAFRRSLTVTPGTQFTFRGYIKGRNVAGPRGASLYVSLRGGRGTDINSRHNLKQNLPLKTFHDKYLRGDFDWTLVEVSGVVPDGYTLFNCGTIAYCTEGEVWFDDFELSFKLPDGELEWSYRLAEPETMTLTALTADDAWELPADQYPLRLVLSYYNFQDSPMDVPIATVPINRLSAGNFRDEDFALYDHGRPLLFFRSGDQLLFALGNIPPRSEKQVNLYLRADRRNRVLHSEQSLASEVLSDYAVKTRDAANYDAYAKLLHSPANLLKNPSFEDDSVWTRAGENVQNDRVKMDFVSGGLFGQRLARMVIPENAPGWFGFRQTVSLKPLTDYLVVVWGRSLTSETFSLRSHYYRASEPGKRRFASAHGNSGGDWTMASMFLRNTYSDGVFEVHLTHNKPCELEFDGVFMAECTALGGVRYDCAVDKLADQRLRVWQLDTIVKVFPFTEPPVTPTPTAISLAGNEAENIQLALRSSVPRRLSISAEEPRRADGQALAPPEIHVVGYVPVDSVSAYPQFTHLKFYERCIPPASFGERYADPLLPQHELELPANDTHAVYIGFSAKAGTPAGSYHGEILFREGAEIVHREPYSVTVHPFAIPERPSISAIFDFRPFPRLIGNVPDMAYRNYERVDMARFLAGKRISIHTSENLQPKFVDGAVEFDFTAFDEYCQVAFAELGVPLHYLPLGGTLFNYGHPPWARYGEAPYEGAHPYEGVDRSVLRPEYRAKITQVVQTVWEHVKAKGWEKHFMFYMSDEPYPHRPGITEQMIALCDMIHEAVPELPIYVSTWSYVPEWLGKIDLWGIGAQGQASIAEIAEIKTRGEVLVTTDGQFCLDTPYNALERLMPLFCHVHGFRGYEFWGVDWHMRNPFKWGFHRDRISHVLPGQYRRNRFPNGDGYFIYPGNMIGYPGIVSCVRLEAIRDGMEDYEYFTLLKALADKSGDNAAKAVLAKARVLTPIPNAGGRKSEQLLPDPSALSALRDEAATHIARLQAAGQ